MMDAVHARRHEHFAHHALEGNRQLDVGVMKQN